MLVHLLVGHREESYPGQYAPEFLEVADEYTMEENPQWLQDKYDEYKKDTSFASLTIVTTTLKTDQIMAALYPENKVENTGVAKDNTPDWEAIGFMPTVPGE